MSQRNVEQVIGRLATDETLRRRFEENPVPALLEIVASGVELTVLELKALASMDRLLLDRFAEALDPRIQKVGCHGGRH